MCVDESSKEKQRKLQEENDESLYAALNVETKDEHLYASYKHQH